jgi:hypothetical protein
VKHSVDPVESFYASLDVRSVIKVFGAHTFAIPLGFQALRFRWLALRPRELETPLPSEPPWILRHVVTHIKVRRYHAPVVNAV